MLTGDTVPIREPRLNGQVFGQDSVVNAVFQGKIYWFWGDTNRPDYPLGNFHVPGAISNPPGYEEKSGPETTIRMVTKASLSDHGARRPRPVAFFAPDRAGIAWLPVYEQFDDVHGQSLLVRGQWPASGTHRRWPLFLILPADIRDYTAATVPSINTARKGSAGGSVPSSVEPECSLAADAQAARSRLAKSRPFASLVMVMPKVPGVGRAPSRGRGIEEEMRWIHACPIPTLSPELERDLSDDRIPPGEKSRLSEIAEQLEINPQECWQAFESLETVEPSLRLSIIDELSLLGCRPGAEMLLRLLSSARDPATRAPLARHSSERIMRHAVRFDSRHHRSAWAARLSAPLAGRTTSGRCRCRPALNVQGRG